MKIGRNSVVSIEYTLKNGAGEVLDASEGDEPLLYMHGAGQIIPGLESALEGRSEGETFKTVISAEEGYGEKSDEEPVRIERSMLPEDAEVEIGAEFEAVGPDERSVLLWVVGIEGDEVLLSADHPLAGETLHFDVSIKSVREATAEELSHGHAHGPGAEFDH